MADLPSPRIPFSSTTCFVLPDSENKEIGDLSNN
jgi:hypothetical protein